MFNHRLFACSCFKLHFKTNLNLFMFILCLQLEYFQSSEDFVAYKFLDKNIIEDDQTLFGAYSNSNWLFIIWTEKKLCWERIKINQLQKCAHERNNFYKFDCAWIKSHKILSDDSELKHIFLISGKSHWIHMMECLYLPSQHFLIVRSRQYIPILQK